MTTLPTYVSWLPKAGDTVVSVSKVDSGFRVYADRTVGTSKVLVEYQFDAAGRYKIDRNSSRRETSAITSANIDTVTFSKDALDLIKEYNSNNEVRRLNDANQTGGLNLVNDIVQIDNAGLYQLTGGNNQRKAYVVGKARQEIEMVPNDRTNVIRYSLQNGSYVKDSTGGFMLDPKSPSGTRYSLQGGNYVENQFGEYILESSGPKRYRLDGNQYIEDPRGDYYLVPQDRYSYKNDGSPVPDPQDPTRMTQPLRLFRDDSGSFLADGTAYQPQYTTNGVPPLVYKKLNFVPAADLNLKLKSDFTDASSAAFEETTPFVRFDQDGSTPLVFLMSEASINGKGGAVKFKTNATAVKRLAEDVKMASGGPVELSSGLQNVFTAKLNGQKLGGGVSSDVLIYAIDVSRKYIGTDANGKAVDVFKDAKGKDLSLAESEKGLTSEATLLLNKDQTLWQPPAGSSISKYRKLGSRIILNITTGNTVQYAVFSGSGVFSKLSTSSVWAG